MGDLAEKVRRKIEAIVDPEVGRTLGEMGLIESVREVEKGVVEVTFTPTSPFCPLAAPLALRIKRVAESVEGVTKAVVKVRHHLTAEAIMKYLEEGGREG